SACNKILIVTMDGPVGTAGIWARGPLEMVVRITISSHHHSVSLHHGDWE
ncbi:hypothetical protein A2U01_0062720, partial [Trifolium medium]|nr:hypothetical protein [Trifolium medium]